jgi:hypothetical protein
MYLKENSQAIQQKIKSEVYNDVNCLVQCVHNIMSETCRPAMDMCITELLKGTLFHSQCLLVIHQSHFHFLNPEGTNV